MSSVSKINFKTRKKENDSYPVRYNPEQWTTVNSPPPPPHPLAISFSNKQMKWHGVQRFNLALWWRTKSKSSRKHLSCHFCFISQWHGDVGVLMFGLILFMGRSCRSVEDPGVYPGSRIRFFPSRIPDPNFSHPRSRIRIFPIPDSGSASKNLTILTQKFVAKAPRKYDPGCSSWLFYPSRIPGSQRHRIPYPQHCLQAVLHRVIRNWRPWRTCRVGVRKCYGSGIQVKSEVSCLVGSRF